MEKKNQRVLGGNKVDVTTYDGKMRFLVGCAFCCPPEPGSDVATGANSRFSIEKFKDGSCMVYCQTLVPDDTDENTLECMMDDALSEIEEAMGFAVGEGLECTSTTWWAGHSDSNYDSLLNEQERAVINGDVVLLEGDVPRKKWQIPVSWEMSGVVCITADTLEDAIDRANNDDSIALPPGNYVDGSFEVAFDDPDGIRALYNNNQPDEVSVRQAIQDFMDFEKETSIIYPFAVVFHELSEDSLRAIEEKCNGNTDTDTLYDAIEEVVGANPKLKDKKFTAAALAEYQTARMQEKLPLSERIELIETQTCEPQPASKVKKRNAEHER